MKIVITEDYDGMSDAAAKIVLALLDAQPAAVLGLATGTTPLGLYDRLAEDGIRTGRNYEHVRTVNLDEYVGLGQESEQSYVYFMRKSLFERVGIPLANTHLPCGTAPDLAAECARYNALLDALPRDLQVLGIGSNGHVAFNEPGTPFGSRTHVVTLAESTVRDNARLFARREDVPIRAVTMGPSDIMQAKKIILLASGANKADAVFGLVKGEVTPSLPASILRLHPDCTLIADRAAASRL